MTLRIAYAGSPEFAASVLQQLTDAGITPVAVFTQPDREAGRGRKIIPAAVKPCAEKLNIPVFQPRRMKDSDAHTALADLQVDVLVVVAYGQILPQSILDLPRLGCLNVHASLLPRWRGAAPIERAVLAGDEETGVAIMQMEAGLDTGPVYREASVPICSTGSDSFQDLETALANLGGQLLLEVLEEFAKGHSIQPEPQSDTGITYAEKLTAQDRQINWHNTANQIQRRIWTLRDRLPVRVQIGGVSMQLLSAQVIEQNLEDSLSPPGCLVDINKHGIYVQCATDMLRITELRMEKGKGSVLNPAAALNGYRKTFIPGHHFSSPD